MLTNTGKKFFLIVFVILVSGCEEKAFNPLTPDGPDFSLTPMENEEAELLALHLSGEIMAPVPLYRKINRDLKIIRRTWSVSINQVTIKYIPFSEPSVIYVGLTPEAFASAEARTYHEWDSLNNFYAIDTIHLLPQFELAILEFKGRLNPLVLVDKYAGLSGFEYIHTSSRIGDWSTLVAILQDDDKVKYFFRDAFGDCPAGCIYSNFFYFTVEQDSAYFHGSYLLDYEPDTVIITWADTALTALRMYPTFNHWPPL